VGGAVVGGVLACLVFRKSLLAVLRRGFLDVQERLAFVNKSLSKSLPSTTTKKPEAQKPLISRYPNPKNYRYFY
jgi:hypothetical protein